MKYTFRKVEDEEGIMHVSKFEFGEDAEVQSYTVITPAGEALEHLEKVKEIFKTSIVNSMLNEQNMKNVNDILHRIEVLTSLVEEIYTLMTTENITTQQEADAEKMIARLRTQIETLNWVLN